MHISVIEGETIRRNMYRRAVTDSKLPTIQIKLPGGKKFARHYLVVRIIKTLIIRQLTAASSSKILYLIGLIPIKSTTTLNHTLITRQLKLNSLFIGLLCVQSTKVLIVLGVYLGI